MALVVTLVLGFCGLSGDFSTRFSVGLVVTLVLGFLWV